MSSRRPLRSTPDHRNPIASAGRNPAYSLARSTFAVHVTPITCAKPSARERRDVLIKLSHDAANTSTAASAKVGPDFVFLAFSSGAPESSSKSRPAERAELTLDRNARAAVFVGKCFVQGRPSTRHRTRHEFLRPSASCETVGAVTVCVMAEPPPPASSLRASQFAPDVYAPTRRSGGLLRTPTICTFRPGSSKRHRTLRALLATAYFHSQAGPSGKTIGLPDPQ